MVADEIGERQNAPIQKLKFKALTNLFTISGQKVLVMKPVTYMNLSGEAVRQAADFYKIPPDHVLVVSDDTALALGQAAHPQGRLRRGTQRPEEHHPPPGHRPVPPAAGGRGEKPHPDYDMADWVLGKFAGEDKKTMDAAVKRAADAVECILAEGLDQGMNRFNG